MRVVGLVLMLGVSLVRGADAAPAQTPRPAHDRVEAALHGHARLARESYAQAVRGLEALRRDVRAFVARPSKETLERARATWIASSDAYARTEVFRFSGGPIDDVHPVTGAHGPEGRINAWPIDEAYLDYVAGAPKGGLISDRAVPVAESTLVHLNAAEDDRQLTLGYHAIEFLLWGQDRDPTGPGARPYTDYLPGDPIRERRAACLTLMVDLVLRDLRSVATEWQPGPRRYVDAFLALPPATALSRALAGPAALAAFELASERIGVPLSSGLEEDELSCFSDATLRGIAANIEGIGLVLEGQRGVQGLLAVMDDSLATDIRVRLAGVRDLVYSIPPPFDAILLAPADDSRRRRLSALAGELLGLAGAIQRASESAIARVDAGGGG